MMQIFLQKFVILNIYLVLLVKNVIKSNNNKYIPVNNNNETLCYKVVDNLCNSYINKDPLVARQNMLKQIQDEEDDIIIQLEKLRKTKG